jgi:hypothetical protein
MAGKGRFYGNDGEASKVGAIIQATVKAIGAMAGLGSLSAKNGEVTTSLSVIGPWRMAGTQN